MGSGGNVVPRITEAEHIGPNDTGDNIEAKRVAAYKWNKASSSWQRDQGDLTPGVDYDQLVVTNTSGTSDTVDFKLSGSTIRSMNITYTNSSVQKVSDELTNVGFS